MEDLYNYLVLSGFLNSAESFLIQRLIDMSPSNMNKKKVRKELTKFGFTSKDVISSLEKKELINVDSEIGINWEGVQKFTSKIQNRLLDISHDLYQLNQVIKTKSSVEGSSSVKISTLTPGTILLAFGSNQTSLSETRLLKEHNTSAGVETLERLAEVGLLKIEERKQSRRISITSEGAALRFLFSVKPELNPSNYKYLEKLLLAPQKMTWDSFLELLNSTTEYPSWVITVLIILTDLGIIKQDNEFVLIKPRSTPAFNQTIAKKLEESISGFIPISIERMFDVLQELLDSNTPKQIQETLSLGPSSVHGILKMLLKFNLVSKNDDKKIYQLSFLGKELASFTELDEFKIALRESIDEYPIFIETMNFIKGQNGQIGFIDLTGFFRTLLVSNFNQAKALSVLRIMSQLRMGIERAEKSGLYRIALETEKGFPE